MDIKEALFVLKEGVATSEMEAALKVVVDSLVTADLDPATRMPTGVLSANGVSFSAAGTSSSGVVQPASDGVTRVVPPGLPALPLALRAVGAGTVITNPNDAITAAKSYSQAAVSPVVLYVKPSTGNDANAGTSPSAPLANAFYAAKTRTDGTVIKFLEDCVISSFDLRYTDASQANGPLLKILDANGYNVTIRDSGPDLTAQTWVQDSTYPAVWTATPSGMNANVANTRVMRQDRTDSEGFPRQFQIYTSLSTLGAAGALGGMYWDNTTKALSISMGGASVKDNRDVLKGLWTNNAAVSRAYIMGACIGYSGIRFEGVQILYADGNNVWPEVWMHNCKQLWGVAKGVDMTKAGLFCATDSLFFASQYDLLNGFGPSVVKKGLIHTVRCQFINSGDRSVFPTDGTLQTTSAHGGTDHVGWGNIYRGSNGQAIADTALSNYNDVTWLVGCTFYPPAISASTLHFGSAATNGSRTAYLDSCKSLGFKFADLQIDLNATVKTYKTDLASVLGGTVQSYSPGAP